jgi:uncharacterized protein (TIGR00369 family)
MSTGELSTARASEIRAILERIPYAKLLGFKIEDLEMGGATMEMEIREELMRNQGIVHGGAIASLIDSAMAFATLSLLEPGQRTTTVDLTVNFLRPISSGKATARAKVVRAGRRIIVLSAEVFDDAQKLVATSLSTYIKD